MEAAEDRHGLVEFRRDLHQHPEISWQEHRTTAKIKEKVAEMGVEPGMIVERNGPGLWIDIPGTGQPKGQPYCILIRADIDALRMNQNNPELPYRSQEKEAAHMCGHDGHTTCLIGFIGQIMEARSAIPSNRKVRCLFQPAQQIVEGAALMIKEGCLQGVDEVYGFHNMNLHSFGHIRILPGPFMAMACHLQITITGTGGHGSEPQILKYALSRTIRLYQTLMEYAEWVRETTKQPLTCMFPVLNSGSACNVISHKVEFCGTIRAFSKKTGDLMIGKVEEELQKMKAEGYDYEMVKMRTPLTSNHPTQTEHLIRVGKAVLGADKVKTDFEPFKGSEDFGLFLEERPGAFFFVTGAQPDSECMLHLPHYNFNDKLIPIVSKIWLELTKDRLNI